MSMPFRLFAILLLFSAGDSYGSPTAAADCPFGNWQNYRGTKLLRTATGSSYMWITERTAIDADGSPRAYHPDDVGKPCGPTGAGLDCPANAGYPNTSWWPTVLAADPAAPRKAYVQSSGSSAGFFVSMTALYDKENSDPRDPTRYVDASTIPYVVFPRPFYQLSGTGKTGDIGIAYHLVTKRHTPFVVGDIGPSEPLGEASIALFEALGGVRPNPRTGGGVAAGRTIFIVFPRSVDARPKAWPLSVQQMTDDLATHLEAIGGQSALDACVDKFD